jgi:hypothetical protein
LGEAVPVDEEKDVVEQEEESGSRPITKARVAGWAATRAADRR